MENKVIQFSSADMQNPAKRAALTDHLAAIGITIAGAGGITGRMPGRNKYLPHTGKKQMDKALARMA